MKVRTDYVTNSSSSSFILSFKDEESIYKTLKEQFPPNLEVGWSSGEEGYFQQLLNEIEKAYRLTENNIREIIEDEDWSIQYSLIYSLEKKGMSYPEIVDFFKTPEGKRMVDKAYEGDFKKIMEKIGDDKVIVQIEHGDSGNGEDGVLEHEILPNLDCTVARFSHH